MVRNQPALKRLLFLTPKDWDDEVVDKAFKAVIVPAGWTLHSSLVDFIRRGDIEGGFLGWPKKAAGRYDGAVSPTTAIGRANATITEIMLRRKAPVWISKDGDLIPVTGLQWAGVWRALLLSE